MEDWIGTLPPGAVGKYASLDGLGKILGGNSLIWSRPDKFNDPFDCQPRFRSPTLTKEIEDACVAEFLRVIENEAASLSFSNPAARVNSLLSMAVRAGRIDREEAVRVFVDGLREAMSPDRKFEKRYFAEVVRHLHDVKVLCLTKAFDSILMWSHYADSHRGALVIFAPISFDSQFTLPKPVTYSDQLPFTFEPDTLPKFFSGQLSSTDPAMLERTMRDVVFTKSEAWKYECELRILGGSGFHPELETEPNKFHMDDVYAVIFGARSKGEDCRTIVSAQISRYPKVQWFRAALSDDRFGIEFNRFE